MRRATEGGGAPALLRWQLACLLEGRRLTSHRRNPCPLCRPAPAGCQGRVGNGPVAGRLPDAGLAQTRRRPRIANGRPSPCRRAPPALMPRPVSGLPERGRDCLSDADTIRRYSGPRADCATPCMRLACTAIPTISQRRQPARGPPDPVSSPQIPAESRTATPSHDRARCGKSATGTAQNTPTDRPACFSACKIRRRKCAQPHIGSNRCEQFSLDPVAPAEFLALVRCACTHRIRSGQNLEFRLRSARHFGSRLRQSST